MIFFQTFFSLVFFLGSLMVCWWLFVNALDFLHPVIIFAFCAALIAQAIYLLRVPLLILVLGVVKFVKWLKNSFESFFVALSLPLWLLGYCVASGDYTLLKTPFKTFNILFRSSSLEFDNFKEFKTIFEKEVKDARLLKTLYDAANLPEIASPNSPISFLIDNNITKPPRHRSGGFSLPSFSAVAVFVFALIFFLYQLR